MNSRTTGGTGIDSLLRSYLGLKSAQLAAVRAMGIENQRSTEEIPREGEAWLYTKDIYRVLQYLEGLPILDNSATVIANIGNHGEPGEIPEDIRL